MIDHNQTAYVGGGSGADNLRSILFMKDYCSYNKLDAVLVSIDVSGF